MAWLSCGNKREATYQKQWQDIEVIPDKHNCGCHGDLVSYEEIWASRPTLIGSKYLLYVNDTVAKRVSNAKFEGFVLYFNKNTYSSDFVFENCLFDGLYVYDAETKYSDYNVQITGGGNIHIYFINCTFKHTSSAVNSVTNYDKITLHFIRCMSLEQHGDHFKVISPYEFSGCYTIGGSPNAKAHTDGFQFSSGSGYVVENYRSEMIPLNTAEVTQVCNCCAFTVFELGEVMVTDFVYLRNAVMNGSGYTLTVGSANGHTLENVHVQNSICGCSYQYHMDSIPSRFTDSVDNVLATKAFVSSVWKEGSVIHFLASNYTNVPRTIIAVDSNGGQTSFTIDKCPKYSEYNPHPEVYVTQEDFPFDIEFTLNVNTDYLVFYDTSVSEENQIRFVDSFEVVQQGTWQLKTTTGKKYIIIGTDDDNPGNTKFFRLLRTYGFPYTMNVEAESMDVEYSGGGHGPKMLGDDVDATIFTEEDAPSLFPNDTNVVELGQYLKTYHLGEVAQHGGSGKTLWDSIYLADSFLDELYNTYTSNGGTKTKEELKEAIMIAKADTDVSQGAPYVLTSRETLQSSYGFAIKSVGIWGGSPSVTVDNITLDLNSIKSWSRYPWRTNGYLSASTVLGNGVHNNTTPYNISRDGNNTPTTDIAWLNEIPYGHVHEFFWHQPFTDVGNTGLRTFFDAIKTLVDAGKAEVVTRSQYEAMGEYVQNPVVSISASRDIIPLNEPDSKSAYTVIATLQDGTTHNVSKEAVVWNDSVDVTTIGIYIVPVTYRGANVNISVVVTDGSTMPVDLHFVYTGRINANNGNYYTDPYSTTYFASSELIKWESDKTYYVTFSGKTSNSGTRPKLQEMFCYDSSGAYLGYFGLSDLQGQLTDAELPDPTQTYATTAYIRIQGRVNEAYKVSQVQDWSCHADTNTPTPELTSISATKTVTQYNVGDTLSTSDIVVTATYADGTTADVTSSATIDTSQVDMTTAGTYSIGVSYTEDGVTKTASINIVVSEVQPFSYDVYKGFGSNTNAVNNIVFLRSNTKRSFCGKANYTPVANQNIDLFGIPVTAGQTVTITLSDTNYMFGVITAKSDKTVDTDYGWIDGTSTSVSITSNGYIVMNFKIGSEGTEEFTDEDIVAIKASLTVTVTEAKVLQSISATKTVTNYNVGDTLSTADITVTATYDDTTTATVVGTYDTSNVDMSTAGTYSIGVSYTEGGVTATTSITITVSGSQTKHVIGTIDYPSYEYTGVSKTCSTKKSLDLSAYAGKTLYAKATSITYTGTDSEEEKVGLFIVLSKDASQNASTYRNASAPTYKAYATEAEIVDSTSGNNFGTYIDETYHYLVCDGRSSSSATANFPVTFAITLEIYYYEDPPTPKVLESITATKTTTTYNVGDTLSTADITVTSHYSDSTTADVTASAIINTASVDMTTAGTYSIGISYTEGGVTETTSITITVSASHTKHVIGTITYPAHEFTAKSQTDGNKVYLDVSSAVGKTLYAHATSISYTGTDSEEDRVGLLMYLSKDKSHTTSTYANAHAEDYKTYSNEEEILDTSTGNNFGLLVDETYHYLLCQGKASSSSTANFPVTFAITLEIYYYDAPPTKELQSISATKTQTSYTVGDTLTTNDIAVTASYSDSTTADVTSSAVINTSSVDMTTEGSYPINISYTEDNITKTSTITITVASAPSPYTILSSKVIDGTQYVVTDIAGNTLYNYEAKVQMQSSNQPQYSGGHLLSQTNTYYPFLRVGQNHQEIFLLRLRELKAVLVRVCHHLIGTPIM